MEDGRVDRVRDDDRLDEPKPELAVLLEAVARLEHRRVGELLVHRGDPSIGAVVEAPVDADRPVHAVHQPAVRAHEPPQPSQVEVERVEETRRGASGDPVQLDHEPALSSSRDERTEELVAAAGRGGSNSWKSARSARPRREPSQSASMRARRRAAGQADGPHARHASCLHLAPHLEPLTIADKLVLRRSNS